MKPYLNLIRWRQQAGTLLLLWPPLWCLFLLSDGFPPVDILVAFALGAFLMRSAGCVINDITDRKLDAKVARTKNRPLAAGAISLWRAFILLIVLLLGALAIAFYLGEGVVLAALPAVPFVILYPWMKRITFWPQLFLGITFNYGVLLASIALTGAIQPAAWLLYAAGIFWTLGYDTIYGFQDIKDDEKIGVKSTARLFKERPQRAVGVMYGAAWFCFSASLISIGVGVFGIVAAIIFAVALCLQVKKLDIANKHLCAVLFNVNAIRVGPFICALLALENVF